MKKEEKSILSIRLFVWIFLIITIGYPIYILVSNVDFSILKSLITSKQFSEALNNSLVVTTISTVLSILIAYLLAYSINRSNIKHKEVLKICITIPMLIPSISHGIGLINLFGNNGLVNSIFNIDIQILGPIGIVCGSILYSFPVAFLMICDAFKYIDNNSYEVAEVLGLNKWQTFKTITFYYLKKPLLSTVFAIFTMIFTDYGVPLAVGARYTTLPVFLYREVIGLLDFSKGTIIGMFLLIPAICSFVFDLITKDYNSDVNTNQQYNIKENKFRDLFCKTYTYVMLTIETIILGSFVILAFMKNYPSDLSLSLDHYKYVFSNNIVKYTLNSVSIALVGAVIGTIVSYLAAYVTARIKSKTSKILHIICISSLAIPGIVLGISYTMTFNGSLIYKSMLILVMVNIVHFFASPYLLAYNALGKLNSNYEVVGMSCGISKLHILRDVIIPNTKQTIYEMFGYIFVNSMVTISAITFLFNSKNKPLSLLINQYEDQMMLEEIAIISLTILTINIIVKLAIYLKKRNNYLRSLKNETINI